MNLLSGFDCFVRDLFDLFSIPYFVLRNSLAGSSLLVLRSAGCVNSWREPWARWEPGMDLAVGHHGNYQGAGDWKVARTCRLADDRQQSLRYGAAGPAAPDGCKSSWFN